MNPSEYDDEGIYCHVPNCSEPRGHGGEHLTGWAQRLNEKGEVAG